MMIKPIGENKYAWHGWSAPNDVDQASIPAAGGIYQLGCVDEKGDMITFSMPTPPTHANTQDLEDISSALYIGMSSNLADRFVELVKSWRTDATRDSHGCRKRKYDNNPDLQRDCPVERIRVRYKVLVPHIEPLPASAGSDSGEGSSSMDHTAPSAASGGDGDNGQPVPTHEEMRKALLPGSTREKTTTAQLVEDGLIRNPRVDVALHAEGRLLRLYLKAYGRLPFLNSQRGEKDLLPDEEFFPDIFGTDWDAEE